MFETSIWLLARADDLRLVPPWELWCVWRNVWATALKKRERGNSQLLLIATCVGCFEDSTVKPCLIKLQFLMKIPYSYFFNLNDVIVYWRSVEVLEILWKAAIRNKFLLPPVLVVSEIQRWNLLQLFWKFYWSFITHSSLFWTVGLEIGAVVCFQKIRERCLFFLWRDSWTLINFNLLIFWAIVGDCFED